MYKLIVLTVFFLVGCGAELKPWPNGEIPYYIDNDFDQEMANKIKFCAAYYNLKTAVKFVKKDQLKKHVVSIKLSDSNSNNATIGYSKKPEVNLVENASVYMILHELAHIVGLQHEHSRLNRDEFVKINLENIKKGEYKNFEIREQHLITDDFSVHPYDYHSITHYAPYAYSANSKKTINLLHYVEEFYQYKAQLSELDVKKINEIYSTTTKEKLDYEY